VEGPLRTIVADFGLRLAEHGLRDIDFLGMADIAGMVRTASGIPYFGPWQATGVLIGEI
jgi:hypothetical protein